MRLRFLPVVGLAVACLLSPVGPASAATIYFDPLDGSSSSNLNGTKPEDRGGTGTGNNWNAASLFDADGSVASGSGSAWLPFTPQSGFIYTLSADVETTEGGEDDDWISLGYASSELTDEPFYDTGGYGTILLRESGSGTSFRGEETAGGDSLGVTTTGPATLEIRLDTRPTSWSFSFFVNGSSVGNAGGVASGDAEDISYVGFSEFSQAEGNVADLTLTRAIPEPASLALVGFGALALLPRRRR